MKAANAASVGAVLLLTVAIAGCDDDTRISSRQDPVQFPMGIGMYWVYEVYDSLTQATDTLEMSMVDTMRIEEDGSFAYVQRLFAGSGDASSMLYSLHDDTLIVYDVGYSGYSRWESFVFPLIPGNMWTGPFDSRYDTSRVVDRETVVTPAAVFGQTARVDRRCKHESSSDYAIFVTWLHPSAGIVKRRIQLHEGDKDVMMVTLIRFDLTTFPRTAFPDIPGTWWRYATYDSLTESTDTITITVKGKLPPLSRDIPITVWEIRSDAADSGIVDTLFVADETQGMLVSGDTLFSGELEDIFDFPQAVGRTWGLEFFAPVPDVVEKKPISVAAGDFETAFRNVTPTNNLNDYKISDTWLVPHVGIVKRHFKRIGLGPVTNLTWELIDFSGIAAP